MTFVAEGYLAAKAREITSEMFREGGPGRGQREDWRDSSLDEIQPSESARLAASEREATPNLLYMLARWRFIVASERRSFSAA